MAKAVRWITMLAILAILASAASASDDKASSSQGTATETQSRTDVQDPNCSADAAAGESQPPPDLDRRDRIFYPGDTERPKPLIRKLALNILFDQEEIFTSPFHMNRHNAWKWLVSGAATGGLIAADRHI